MTKATTATPTEREKGRVVAEAAMSLDGFVAFPDDTVGPLFDWYSNGQVAIAPGDPEREFRVSDVTATYLNEHWPSIGAVVIGRRLFDLTDGWDGRPAAGDHVFVVTHQAPADWPHRDEAPFTFVTDGLASALRQAREFAGERDVSLTGGNLTGQALAAGLLDELDVALVPVVLGQGVRFFGDYAGEPVLLDDPHEVVRGDRVTHLRYRVRTG